MLYLKLSIGLVKLGESEKSVCDILPPPVIHTNSLSNTKVLVELQELLLEFRLGGATMEETATKLLLFFFSQEP